jgi:hypothetical protein
MRALLNIKDAFNRSCLVGWCRIGHANHHGSQRSGRGGQAATVGSKMGSSSPSWAMVSSVI